MVREGCQDPEHSPFLHLVGDESSTGGRRCNSGDVHHSTCKYNGFPCGYLYLFELFLCNCLSGTSSPITPEAVHLLDVCLYALFEWLFMYLIVIESLVAQTIHAF